MTYSAEAEILRLLRAGHHAYLVAPMTGYSYRTVRDLRDAHEIPTQGAGSRLARPDRQYNDAPEEEGTGRGAGDPWIPPPGYDMSADRPHQRLWLARCAGAGPRRATRLRAVVCRVLGVPVYASDRQLEDAVIADRRTAEQLATAYLARVGGWSA